MVVSVDDVRVGNFDVRVGNCDVRIVVADIVATMLVIGGSVIENGFCGVCVVSKQASENRLKQKF